MLKRKTRCLRQPATDRVEAVIPKMFDPGEMAMTDVEFQLEEGPNIRAHKFILSLSPVLKSALSNIDVRICPIPVISLQGFHRESVQNLLHFLYKGVVDMVWGSEIHTDFMKLCKALRVNPRSVRRTWGTSEEANVPSGNEADDVEPNGEAATNDEVAPDIEEDEQMVEEEADEEAESNATPDMDVAEKTDVEYKEAVEGESSIGDAVADEDVRENAISDISDETNEAAENIDTVVHVNKEQEEEKGVKSGDQIDHEDNLREENNNLALDLVNIDELGLDTSSDNATEEKQFNYDSVSNDEPDGASVIDALKDPVIDALKDPVIEGDASGAKVDIENPSVITEEKSDSSDERTQEMNGAGDKLEQVFEKDSINDVSRDSLEGVKDGTTEIVKSKPERHVCDICVEVFSACRDLEEHKQTVHLIDEISDDDTQEETTEAIFDFLSKDLGITSQEMKKPETNQNVPEISQETAAATTDEDLAIRIENVASLDNDKLNEPFSLDDMNGATVKDEIPESEPFEFKMPDSFDLSVDYIKEIVPFNASNKVEYIGSDDENEDAIGFIGLNKLEFKMPLTDLSSEIREELDNQPVPDENPSDDLNVIPAESSSSRHRSETPDSVEAITYKKDKSSKSSMRSREKPLQSKRDRKKKDRKLMNSLFGSDEVVSEGSSNKKERHSSPSKESWPAKKERKEGKSSKKERVVDEERKTMTPSPDGRTSSPPRTPTPTMSISEELKEKRERMMRKMKCDTEEKLDEKLESRDFKEKKRRRKKESSPRKRSGGTPQKAPSHHGTHHKGCNSSCRIDHRWSDDESWLVPDDYESSSESEPLISDHVVKVEKREESKSRSKTKVKQVEEVKREDSTDDDFIDDEDEDEEDEEAKRNRKKRLAERKKKAGGDVLFWMNPGHKSKVRVSVQMFAKEDIMDMNYYKMKLLADEGSDTDVEVSKKESFDSDVSSEVSSKRSKSPDYVKRMLDSDTDNSQVKRKKHKKKRKKKKRHSSSNGTPNSSEKYKRPVSDSSDEDVKPKSKLPKFHRSVSHVSHFGESSKRSNSFTKPVIQRSFSTLESLGISHNYGLSGEAKERSSMPKIPKIVKPSTEMPKIPKIEKATTEMPKIPKFAKIPKIL